LSFSSFCSINLNIAEHSIPPKNRRLGVSDRGQYPQREVDTLLALTDLKIKKAASRDKPYKLSDGGGGLILLVKPNGSKRWQ